MYIDARQLEADSLVEGDLCIVGAGPAGIGIALDWMGRQQKVILLESGGFDYDDTIQDSYKGENTGLPYFSLRSTRLHYFGGTSGHWGGFCAKLDPIDFKKRAWINDSGWPISLQDIEPYYPKAHELVELGPYQWTADYWTKEKPAFKSLFPANNYLWDKIWQISPPTRFGDKYRDAIIHAPNIHLYTYANLTDITTNETGDYITTATIKTPAGKKYTVKARQFILAGGAIQNARMLLAANKQQPNGLGNQYDVVGRYFMEHIEIKSGELWLLEPHSLAFYMLNTTARAEIAVKEATQEKLGITNGTISLSPLNVANRLPSQNRSWSGDDPRKNLKTLHSDVEKADENKLLKHLKKNYRTAFGMFSRFESVPDRDSRVFLDRETDAFGTPLASLHWKLSELDKISIRRMHELIGQQLGAAGLGRVKLVGSIADPNNNSWAEDAIGGWHHIGTTRMGTDPHTSVVDQNCQVHGIHNLYCAGSSCFSTAGAVNPTLSLIALSLRLSDFLKNKRNF